MSISGQRGYQGLADSPAGVLAGLVGSVRDAAETRWAARSDEELVGVVEEIGRLRAALAAIEAGAVAEADARDLARDRLHYGSTADWLTHTGGLRKGEGKRVVARARALTGPLTTTRQALADGTVSVEQVEVVLAAVEALPAGALVRRRGERLLLEQAQALDASELGRAGRHLAQVVDPDGLDRKLEAALDRDDRAAHLTRTLSITPDRAGGVRITGRGSVEDAAVLKAALMPLTGPAPATDQHDDEHGQLTRDPRDHGARLWDALVAVAQHALDTHLPPETHGTRPRVVVTLDHATLRDGVQSSGLAPTTDDGWELTPSVVRRLACDADLVPAVLGTGGEVLDVGRTRRLVTPALWTALVVRDRHCAFPACTRPPVMCHAHHLHHWADGGPTSLDNLALLCGHHHRVIHHSPWDVQINPQDKKPEFLPPPKPESPRQWLRNRPRRT